MRLNSHRCGYINSLLAAILCWGKKHICQWCALLPRIHLYFFELWPISQNCENGIKAAAAGMSPYRAHYRDTDTGGLSTGLDYPIQIPEKDGRLMTLKRQMPQPQDCMWARTFRHTRAHTHLCKMAFFRLQLATFILPLISTSISG